LTYLGDKESPAIIRVQIPYLLLNRYKNILASFDFVMTNSLIYYKDLNVLQFQKSALKDQSEVIKAIKEQVVPKTGTKLFYDCDDLITAVPKYSKVHDYYQSNLEYIEKILPLVDCIMCSTSQLAENFKKYNKTKVIQNRLFESIWKKQNHISFFETGNKPKIIWAGGHTHFSKDGVTEDDFDKKIIQYIKDTSKKFEWIFCGNKPEELTDFVTYYKWNPNYFEYPNMLRDINADIGIALLQTNEFNKCKSNIKALELVSLGIPGVYSKITPYQFMTCKIENSDQFINRIETLTTDQNYYEKVQRKDYEAIKDNLYWDDKAITKYLDAYLK
jgi:hypothetical protein